LTLIFPTHSVLIAGMKRALFLRLICLIALIGLPSCEKSDSQLAEEPAVRAFLERYFSTWSAQDMDGYAACFHESARVTYVADRSGNQRTETLSDFLHGQRMGHKTATEPMTEIADSMDIQTDDRAALARVHWTLLKGAQKSTGIDHFSLIKTTSGWKIMHLLFYAD
jgi:hypothetical protein